MRGRLPDTAMTSVNPFTSIDEYLRERMMRAQGVIPHIPGIEVFGRSIPAGTAGGDLCKYITFQQRYDIEARIRVMFEKRRSPLARYLKDDLKFDGHSEKQTSHTDHQANWQFLRAKDVTEQIRSTVGNPGLINEILRRYHKNTDPNDACDSVERTEMLSGGGERTERGSSGRVPASSASSSLPRNPTYLGL
jgi:hypothetical protein